MITPVILKALFWIVVLVIVVGAIVTMVGGQFWYGLLSLILGPFVLRIFFELILVTFQINDSLADIRKNTQKGA